MGEVADNVMGTAWFNMVVTTCPDANGADNGCKPTIAACHPTTRSYVNWPVYVPAVTAVWDSAAHK
jgi:hypothetical protein